MNEIKKVHIGRQPFVIAVDAYKLLQDYLLAIKHQVGKNSESVTEEVELRMAELLTERGISGETVILADDVAYLKQQLGAPRDFKDDDEAEEAESDGRDEQAEPVRRLFRDTEHGMLAGVASGLAAYFGIDAIIVRLIFVVATLSGGWGAAVYIVMWLIMPEARTASERLQMRGKAVTVDSLKEIVDRADVPGAAHRVSRNLITVIEVTVKIALVVAGIALAITAAGILVGLAMAGTYALTHSGHIIHGAVTFPLGTPETVAVAGGIAVLASVSAFLLATSVAMIRRKWSLPGWAIAALLSLLVVGTIATGVAMPDTIQGVRDRYDQNIHTVTRTVQPFKQVDVEQGAAGIHVQYAVDPSLRNASAYKVDVRYLGDAPVGDIKTSVKDTTLTIDARGFKPGTDWDCDGLCIGARDYFEVTVYTPQPLAEPDLTAKPTDPKAAPIIE